MTCATTGNPWAAAAAPRRPSTRSAGDAAGRPDGGDAPTRDLLGAVCAALRARSAEVTDELMRRFRLDIPELRDNDDASALLRSATEHHLITALHIVEHDLEPTRAEASPLVLEYARRLAQRGVGACVLPRAHQLGLATLTRWLLTEIHRSTSDAQLTGAATLRMTGALFAYTDRVTEQTSAAHQQARQRWPTSRVPLRSAALAPLLTRGDADAATAENALAYRLAQTHVGVIAWCTDSRPDPAARLERYVTRLAQRLGCDGAPLLALHDESTLWAWLPRGTDRQCVEAAAERGAACADGELWIALGEPGAGVEGFRRSHRQASSARAVVLAASPEKRSRVAAFGRLAPIALMASDIDGMRTWVAHTLGGLAVDDDTCGRLRDTLRIFLTNGGSFTSTAAQLNLHKNTVQYRIRRATEARGRPLNDRRLDVELSLLACHLLGATVLTPAKPPSPRSTPATPRSR